MSAPGYYKTNYRALRFRELVRMHGLPGAFKAYLICRFKRADNGGWMPSLWADTECRQEDLSEYIWQATKPHRLNFEQLGFNVCGFLKVTKSLNPMLRDSGGVTYLDPTRRYFGQLLYHRLYIPSSGRELNTVVIAFTAAFEDGCLSCTNAKKAFDPPSDSQVIRLNACDVLFMHQQFLQQLRQRQETPQEFPSLESLRRWFDSRQIKSFEERVQRRLFIPMTWPEVEVAKRRLQETHATSGSPPPVAIRKLTFWLLLITAIIFLEFIRQPHRERTDTLEYQGQHFKMKRAYASYEDYKDDPDNLDTNELGRIEQAVISAKIPPTFKDRKAFIHTLIFDLQFPGYGGGGMGGQSQTDDGSTLDVQSVEIPQRDKERYIVVRESRIGWTFVDDFVATTATNAIARVKLEKQKLLYYNQNGGLVREKQL